jgi:hypothetical protein
MKILNIYGQEAWHDDARIVGNREGLEALRAVIADALSQGAATSQSVDPIFASDGEGYEVIVELHNDPWGIDKATGKLDPSSFWNTEKSNPQYLLLERMGDGK